MSAYDKSYIVRPGGRQIFPSPVQQERSPGQSKHMSRRLLSEMLSVKILYIHVR